MEVIIEGVVQPPRIKHRVGSAGTHSSTTRRDGHSRSTSSSAHTASSSSVQITPSSSSSSASVSTSSKSGGRVHPRRPRRKSSKKYALSLLPPEILQKVLLYLEPSELKSSSMVCKKLSYIGTPRFWKLILESYWHVQQPSKDAVNKRLSLKATSPVPQIHFMSHRSYALSTQEVYEYAMNLLESGIMPFDGTCFFGLTLPDLTVRNNLARFYPHREFYLAALGTTSERFVFKALFLNKEGVDGQHKSGKSRKSPRIRPVRYFFPLGLKAVSEQEGFLKNFVGARVTGSPNAMLLASTITSIMAATHNSCSPGRLSIRIPGVNTLPPPKDIDKFYIRSTILISKIPSLCLEFKFEGGELADLVMHNPNMPWTFV